MDNFPYIEIYKQFCKKVSQDSDLFKVFKKHDDYTPMLEHVSPYHGMEYFKVIKERNPQLLSKIEEFKKNDQFGSPNTFNYPEIGEMSPTTLRYIKTLSDIVEMFDSLDNETIVEAGGGYGGQCKIISTWFKFKKYTILDLPDVTPLINRYIIETSTPNSVAIPFSELTEFSYDFFISNYALTEFPKQVQMEYIDKVINNCTHGYITCNFISADCGITSLGKDEFLGRIKHSWQIIDEFPNTHPQNFILVW